MKMAQKLYEGVDIDGKIISLVTYIRTDSTYINEGFVKELSIYLQDKTNIKPRNIPTQKNKGAHESIRPVYFAIYPDEIKDFIDTSLHKLYQYIYYTTARFVMAPPLIEVLNLKIGNDIIFTTLSSKRYIEKNSDL